jgi:UDP-2-acetamido-2,6-beta-L-arabino-hexul-4-ose reductase
MNILITGAQGFIGRNLAAWLGQRPDDVVRGCDVGDTRAELEQALAQADIVFHLAGVNRPQSEREFQAGNVDFTAQVCDWLLSQGRSVPVVLTSSAQAALDNPYGISKRQAEAVVADYAQRSGARAAIYRLPNVFGKWCRPNYNSVVATFCHNIAHDLPVAISDPARVLDLVHVDDVADRFERELSSDEAGVHFRAVEPVHRIALGELAERIQAFRRSRQTLRLPDLADDFTRKLYGVYLTYLEPGDIAYSLQKKCDARGCLAEFVKAPSFGQIFVSRTAPGVTRGNHYHHAKAEKFLVLEGEAVIRLRRLDGAEVIEFPVRGEDFRVVDIPPGYTHSIENAGAGELVTLFWSSELFDPQRPDTRALPVLPA